MFTVQVLCEAPLLSYCYSRNNSAFKQTQHRNINYHHQTEQNQGLSEFYSDAVLRLNSFPVYAEIAHNAIYTLCTKSKLPSAPRAIWVLRVSFFLPSFLSFLLPLGSDVCPQHHLSTTQRLFNTQVVFFIFRERCGFVCFTTLVLHYCSCLDSERPPWKPRPIHWRLLLKVRGRRIPHLLMKWLDCFRSHHSLVTQLH